MTISSIITKIPHPKSLKGNLEAELSLAWAVTLALFNASDQVTFYLVTDKSVRLSLDLSFQEKVGSALDKVVNQIQEPDVDHSLVHSVSQLAIYKAGQTSPSSDGSTKEVSLACAIDTNFITIHLTGGGSSRPEWQSRQILRHFGHLVGQLSHSDRAAPLYAATTLSIDDQEMIYRWNESNVPLISRCIHNEIHAKCLEQPDALAIDAFDGSFTYHELDDLSSTLANYLTVQGVSNETPCFLLFEKSRWFTVAMIAVMKAGGAFVPLDPSRPRQQIESVCQSLNAQVVLCSSSHVSTASALARCVVPVRDDVVGSWVNPIVPLAFTRPDQAAYIAFTSGSTGVPKGAVIEHRSFMTGAIAHGRAYDMSRETRVLQFSSYSFDGCIMENLTTLLFGGCVCVPSDEDRLNNLPACITEFRATTICLTPTVLRLIRPDEVSCLKIVLLTGEAPSTADVETWSTRVKLILTYGVTECSVACSAYQATANLNDIRSIGQPLACRWWVVSPHRHDLLVPIGSIGELCVEGPIVGRGYISDHTIQRDAFSLKSGWLNVAQGISRIYRTGDLVQYQLDGSLILLGRKDTQVKLHGQRIELQGIESLLRSSLEEEDEVIAELCKPVSRGEKQTLVAFILNKTLAKRHNASNNSCLVPHSEEFLRLSVEIKEQLQLAMPKSMTPTWFFQVAHWPQTATGKTDRRCLRDMVNTMGKVDVGNYATLPSVSPHMPGIRDLVLDDTPVKLELKSLVSNVLGCDIEDLKDNDNFFSKGADSVTVMQLAIAVRATGVPLSIGEIFDHPVLMELERHIQQKTVKGLDDSIEIQTAQPFSLLNVARADLWVQQYIAPQVPLSSGQVISDVLPATQMQAYLAEFPRQYYALYLEGTIDKGRLKTACENLVQRHSILRTMHTEHDGQLFQVVLNKADTSFVCYESISEADMEELIQRAFAHDTTMPIHSGTQAVQFTLYTSREQPTKQMLQLRLLHTQEDGESWLVLVRDLAALYNKQPLLPAVSFADWTYSYFSHRTPSTWRYWSDLLSGASMSYIGTAFAPKTAEESLYDETKMVPFRKPPKGFTMATAVKAAWSLVLAHHLNNADVTFGESVHGRAQPFRGVETVVGPCVNIIPVRIQQKWASQTGLDLMRIIQKQHAQSLAYSSVDIKDIVTNCTDWKVHHTSQQWGSFVLHSEVNYYTAFTDMQIGDAKITKQDMFYAPIAVRELILYSMPMGEEHMLTIATNNAIVKPKMAAYLLELTENYLGYLLEKPETHLQQMKHRGQTIKMPLLDGE